jgi:hypothetical protein
MGLGEIRPALFSYGSIKLYNQKLYVLSDRRLIDSEKARASTPAHLSSDLVAFGCVAVGCVDAATQQQVRSLLRCKNWNLSLM